MRPRGRFGIGGKSGIGRSGRGRRRWKRSGGSMRHCRLLGNPMRPYSRSSTRLHPPRRSRRLADDSSGSSSAAHCRQRLRRTGSPAHGIRMPAASSNRRPRRDSKRSRRSWMLDVLGLPDGCGAGFVTCATMANFAALAAARHALFARKGWDVDTRRPVRGAADHRRRRRGSARQRAQSAWPARARTRSRAAGAGRRSGTHARRCAAAARRSHHRLHPGRQREHRRVRSRRCDRAAGATCRRVGARGWRIRAVGRGRSGAGAPARGVRRCRFVGDRRPQVAQRAVRQRHRVRPRTASTCAVR